MLKTLHILTRVLMIIVIIIFLTVTIEQAMKNIPGEGGDVNKHKLSHGYLVWGPNCKIPDTDPFPDEILKIYEKLEYKPCTKELPLTYIKQNFVNDTVIVKLHKSLLISQLTNDQQFYTCCYSEIIRSGEGKKADKEYKLSKCKIFRKSFELPASIEFFIIKCMVGDSHKLKNVYKNAHALIRRKETKQKTNTNKPISVLMFGIDSVSRLNLLRAMPETAQHLQNTGWFELQGYNKIGLNTFPNTMAVLAGMNRNSSMEKCNPNEIGKLDECKFIWKNFKKYGYATAYAEDFTTGNTFNCHKYGFLKPPTDHYFRPFGLAAEKFLKPKGYRQICMGYQNYADYIFQYGIDFAKIYQNQSYFGFFWTSTFSHGHLNYPSMMDLKIKSYMERLRHEGILNSGIVVFFSDHGLRQGPVGNLKTGWIEDRLPFIFIWLPEWFQKEHPKFVKNLRINRNRLTTPYDLHMTLKHILEISGAEEDFPPAEDCPDCQSLFKEMPWNRSCEDAGIDGHFCTCRSFEEVDKSNEHVRDVILFTIDHINSDLKNLIDIKICAKLELNEILRTKVNKFEQIFTDYVVLFNTYPVNASFEATVRFTQNNTTENFEMLGPVSRTNRYGNQSYCIEDVFLKPYCYCIK